MTTKMHPMKLATNYVRFGNWISQCKPLKSEKRLLRIQNELNRIVKLNLYLDIVYRYGI